MLQVDWLRLARWHSAADDALRALLEMRFGHPYNAAVFRPTALHSERSLMKSPRVRLAPALLLLISVVLVNRAPAQETPAVMPNTVAGGVRLVSVYHDGRFFEGPAWDTKTQKLYFTAFGKV